MGKGETKRKEEREEGGGRIRTMEGHGEERN
jgi:hypothetical protein